MIWKNKIRYIDIFGKHIHVSSTFVNLILYKHTAQRKMKLLSGLVTHSKKILESFIVPSHPLVTRINCIWNEHSHIIYWMDSIFFSQYNFYCFIETYASIWVLSITPIQIYITQKNLILNIYIYIYIILFSRYDFDFKHTHILLVTYYVGVYIYIYI